MLNLRKLKQDFSSNVLKEGKQIFDEDKVISAKIVHLDPAVLRVNAKILGQYNNTYESEIEIDRSDCETIDSDCDCPYHYDCQHLAALLYYLEANLDAIVVEYSKENDLEQLSETIELDEAEKEKLLEVVKEAEAKEGQRRDEQYQKELLQEYIHSSKVLSRSPFFLPVCEKQVDRAELAMICNLSKEHKKPIVELQLALRLPFRSKPLHIPVAREFIDGIRYQEEVIIGGKQYLFSLKSFDEDYQEITRMLIDYARFADKGAGDKSQRLVGMELKAFGHILSRAFDIEYKKLQCQHGSFQDQSQFVLPCIYVESLETPLLFCHKPAQFKLGVEYIDPPASKILLNPSLHVEEEQIALEDVTFFESATPGMLYQNVYYRFDHNISRLHLLHIKEMREVTIPEPLFGTFVENSLPVLNQFCIVENGNITEKFVTLPYVEKMQAICDLSFLDGELEADLKFQYGRHLVPACVQKMQQEDLNSFITESGIVARNLVEEQQLIDGVFQDFVFNESQGFFVAKSEKKIIEFMTDTIPRYKEQITFNCPQNLLDQFIYDESSFSIALTHTGRMDSYELELKVEGKLQGIKLDRIWECVLSKRAFLELEGAEIGKKKTKSTKAKLPKILVLDLNKIGKIVQLFDELRIQKLSNHKIECPLWTLANIDASNFTELPVAFSMTEQLQEIRKQMLGEKPFDFTPIPKVIKATLRNYQADGVQWLERLRLMYLSGVLADDMGLGKTLQAIVAVSQAHQEGDISLVVCPTSLLYNWYEEIIKFNPKLKVIVIDGVPNQRKKLIKNIKKYDVIVTSYSLLQKDIEMYQPTLFKYSILDEAQHIKNRGTRNAKSVKMINAEHRLILSGTPIENSLDELWSLFDYLMPGFLSSYDRFVEKYIRVPKEEQSSNLEYLKKKVAPFIMRRMKEDVLDDLPPVSEITYRCHLTDFQEELYKSYAASARDELTKLVERDGFDKVQIHVLATLTRLKQICCHPAIFAKELPQDGDSAKYEMLIELVQNLIEGNHKTVIFSQYTKMLQIMRGDFEKMGIRFCYLDGSTKNRLDIVKQFNEDSKISLFLVSLKAGGTGLNLVGADTVIHYDMWWNPAVENQATDRVHRIGQNRSVSVYKLVTMSTIEEKIVEMQKRKQGLVKKVVSCDEEAISKLTWEDVLELLQG